MQPIRPRSLRGPLPAPGEPYGQSVLGAPLLFFPAREDQGDCGLIIAGTHGDESASIVTLSCALRTLDADQRRHHVVLAVNPDACQLGLRSNANGVDLNRNFATTNWQDSESTYRWNSQATERDVALSTGTEPGSEPETRALCQLIARLQPAWVVSFHEPLGCIEQANASPLAYWLAAKFDLPLVDSVGYATPGSFGSWCEENGLPCITAELPVIANDTATVRYLDAMVSLLQYQEGIGD